MGARSACQRHTPGPDLSVTYLSSGDVYIYTGVGENSQILDLCRKSMLQKHVYDESITLKKERLFQPTIFYPI
jgi:hypothetical protein